MTVEELIKALSQFPKNMEVIVTDGYDARYYQGSWLIQEFEGTVDIGIGGTLQE